VNRQILAALGLLLSLAVMGCGSEGDPAAAQASCTAFCNAYIAASCPEYTSVSQCQANECGHAAGAPANCQATIKAYYDCRRTQADICGTTACVWFCTG
jgi:hypothetical protein